MNHKIRWILGFAVVLGFGLSACTSPTLPRFPEEDPDQDPQDPSDDPGQAMIIEGLEFAQAPIIV